MTRRERNENAKVETPEFFVPFAGLHIWKWFIQIDSAIDRVHDGFCRKIPPSEFYAWQKITGTIVLPIEYAILSDMDSAHCSEMNKEFEARREKKRFEQEQANKAKPGRM